MVTRPRINHRNYTFKLSAVSFLLWLVLTCAFVFTAMLIQAIAFRWSVSLTIEIWEWYRQVLNNLAGAVGA